MDKKLWSLSLAALGVVYGDIGTSPLYAIKVSLHNLPINVENILGILSLIFWSLLLVISTRYMTVFLRADHDGEGGVLALLALLRKKTKSYQLLLILAILGAGLLLGDGMLTPAISVLSAIEGLEVISPTLAQYILPSTIIILFALFLSQRFGTAKIGQYFGPIVLLWFIIIGVLGLVYIYQTPMVISAINPYHAIKFFYLNGVKGYLILGSVFLVITGAEAMYADLGHFGRKPIRIGWFAVALPGLLLNYFGQGALLIENPAAIANPFYLLAPEWFNFSLLILATITCIIASQAVISASFSLTKQAVSLNLCPRLSIIQTSKEERGQIYVPQINVILAIGTFLLILFFRSSENIAGAYGIAVNLVMIIVGILVINIAHQTWGWSYARIFMVFSGFMLIDFAFLGANLHKIAEGGWIPLVFSAICAIIMLTWQQGIKRLRSAHYKKKVDLKTLIHEFEPSQFKCVHNTTAVFITDRYDLSGGDILHYLKLNQVLPEKVLIVRIFIRRRPYIAHKKRFKLEKFTDNIYRLTLHYGFSQIINLPKTLKMGVRLKAIPFTMPLKQTLFLIESINIKVTKERNPVLFLQKKMFSFLLRSSTLEIDFYRLPYTRTITIGTYYKI